jgi:hypothetical protein
MTAQSQIAFLYMHLTFNTMDKFQYQPDALDWNPFAAMSASDSHFKLQSQDNDAVR